MHPTNPWTSRPGTPHSPLHQLESRRTLTPGPHRRCSANGVGGLAVCVRVCVSMDDREVATGTHTREGRRGASRMGWAISAPCPRHPTVVPSIGLTTKRTCTSIGDYKEEPEPRSAHASRGSRFDFPCRDPPIVHESRWSLRRCDVADFFKAPCPFRSRSTQQQHNRQGAGPWPLASTALSKATELLITQ